MAYDTQVMIVCGITLLTFAIPVLGTMLYCWIKG